MSNTKVFGILICVTVLLVLPTFQSEAKVKVCGMRYEPWRLCTGEEKRWYVQGVLDGMTTGDFKVAGTPVPDDATVDGIMKAVDRFYADEENRRIPVLFSLEIIFMEANGKPKDLQARALARLRADFAEK